jgi:hypothetical protein
MAKKRVKKTRHVAAIAAVVIIVAAIIVYALYAFPAITAIGTQATVYPYQNETLFASRNGYTLNSSKFQCGYSSQCAKVQVSPCNNNEPSQFICINSAYAGKLANSTSGSASVCPQYLLAGVISCRCTSNYCTEVYTR